MRLIEIGDGSVVVEVGGQECQRMVEAFELAETATLGAFVPPAHLFQREDLGMLFGALAMFWEAAGIAADRIAPPLAERRQEERSREAERLHQTAARLAPPAPPTEKPWPPRTAPGRKTDQLSGELAVPDESERDPNQVVQELFTLVGRQAGTGIIAGAIKNAMDATGESLDSPAGAFWQELITDAAARHAEESGTLQSLHERAAEMFGEEAAWQLFADVLVDGLEEEGSDEADKSP